MADAPDLRNAYFDPDSATDPPAVSKVERALICDTLELAGPVAPTLSGKWDTHHLAAHLVVRERNPISSVRAAIPALGNPLVESLVAEGDYAGLVARIRSGPPRLSPFGRAAGDRNLNTLEFYIHHEDVLRASSGWLRRQLPVWAENQIWARLRILAKLSMRRSPVPVALQRSDKDGEPPSTASKGPDPVVVRGLPSELALYAYGRGQVASYELDGGDAAVEKLRASHFGR